ncbi:MAG: hypothetical protein GX752_03855 [Clostridium sp.]|nr:hypothetical protein [Clostridium sp.]
MSLLDNINKRKSERDFDSSFLDENTLNKIQTIFDSSPHLFEGIKTKYHIIDSNNSLYKEIKGIIGSNKKVSSPYYAILTTEYKPGYRQSLGYSLAYSVLSLNNIGIGSCIVYPSFNEEIFKKKLKLKENEVTGIFIAFGRSKDPLNFYPKPSYYKRRDIEDIVLSGEISPISKLVLDSLRLAPSSFNSQPWRIYLEENKIHLLRVKLGFIKSALFESLNKIDMGIALFYILVTLKEKNIEFSLIKEPFNNEIGEYMITIKYKES